MESLRLLGVPANTARDQEQVVRSPAAKATWHRRCLSTACSSTSRKTVVEAVDTMVLGKPAHIRDSIRRTRNRLKPLSRKKAPEHGRSGGDKCFEPPEILLPRESPEAALARVLNQSRSDHGSVPTARINRHANRPGAINAVLGISLSSPGLVIRLNSG